jgi:dTDP-4-dehydrorhamnose reductase
MPGTSAVPSLAIWAGIECTINRVGDRYFDQLGRSGHDRRLDDIDRLADLGVRALRYPVLWERASRGYFPDAPLARLRDLGVDAIAGLLHHGSGPVDTSLVDDSFPERLAEYAGAIARRYPWITAYTPVNEPLTTARFSGLYGHWYPHGRTPALFARALVHQCKASVLAMRAIRAVTPGARFVSTEDLGIVHSTRPLAYQAAFENDRRWLSLDLLCGLVDRAHPLRPWLRTVGIRDDELDWFADHACGPDVIGCNYYVTSERYLDDDLAAWPEHEHGGNGRDRYADVAAARACGLVGLRALLEQCHARFARPLAVTECHLGGTRCDQLRWLVSLHDEAARAAAAGIPVVGFTAWAAFGSYDWSSLCTREAGHYEPGLFDVSGGTPRPTALATAVRALAAGQRPDHPVLLGRGWWERAARRAAA